MDPEKTTTASEEQVEDVQSYPPRKVVIPAMAGIYLACFLVALDRTILGTATPAISNEFSSFGDIAWYEAAFLLPLCVLQLSFGRVYTYYSTKWVLITLVAVFELGSLICALAPTSSVVIAGRAISGIGAGGTTAGGLTLINTLVPLRSRPKYAGGIGTVFGLSSILGPLLGGYLTAITWRWVFWINLPIGAFALLVLVIATPRSPPPSQPAATFWGKIKQLDPIGFFFVAPAAVCLLFALQWGGIRYPWSDVRIIVLFVLGGVLVAAFVAVQIWLKDEATVPPKIVRQRSILAAIVMSLGTGTTIVVYSFYLPIWFQVVRVDTPQSSGVSLLAFLLSVVVMVVLSGVGTSVLGYYNPWAIAGGVLLIVGSGLITTWRPDTSTGILVGFQIIVGVGQGLSLQQPFIAGQTVLSKEEAPTGLSLINFMSFFGGTIFVTVSQTLLQNKLAAGLAGKIPNFDASMVANGGAASLRSSVPAEQLPEVLDIFNDSLRYIWYLGLAVSFLSLIGALGLEWESVKKEEKAMKEKDVKDAE